MSQRKLPELKLKKFSGKVEDWHFYEEWRNQFDSAVHTNTRVTDSDKMSYMKSFLTGEALTLIKHLPCTSDNYLVARNLLQERYNKPIVITSMLFRKLIAMKQPENKPMAEHRHHCSNLKDLLARLEARQATLADLMMILAEAQIPEPVVKRWKVKMLPDTEQTARNLIDYYSHEITNDELKIKSLQGEDKSTSKGPQSQPHSQQQQVKRTTTNQVASEGQRDDDNCPFGDGKHAAKDCLKKMKPKTRFDMVKKRGICMVCLEKGHIKDACPLGKPSCKIDDTCKLHHPVFHNRPEGKPEKE